MPQDNPRLPRVRYANAFNLNEPIQKAIGQAPYLISQPDGKDGPEDLAANWFVYVRTGWLAAEKLDSDDFLVLLRRITGVRVQLVDEHQFRDGFSAVKYEIDFTILRNRAEVTKIIQGIDLRSLNTD